MRRCLILLAVLLQALSMLAASPISDQIGQNYNSSVIDLGSNSTQKGATDLNMSFNTTASYSEKPEFVIPDTGLVMRFNDPFRLIEEGRAEMYLCIMGQLRSIAIYSLFHASPSNLPVIGDRMWRYPDEAGPKTMVFRFRSVPRFTGEVRWSELARIGNFVGWVYERTGWRATHYEILNGRNDVVGMGYFGPLGPLGHVDESAVVHGDVIGDGSPLQTS